MKNCEKALKLFLEGFLVKSDEEARRKWIEINKHAKQCQACNVILNSIYRGVESGERIERMELEKLVGEEIKLKERRASVLTDLFERASSFCLLLTRPKAVIEHFSCIPIWSTIKTGWSTICKTSSRLLDMGLLRRQRLFLAVLRTLGYFFGAVAGISLVLGVLLRLALAPWGSIMFDIIPISYFRFAEVCLLFAIAFGIAAVLEGKRK